jgi:short-subunit dehydrogenase
MIARHAFTEKYGPWAIVTGASDGIGKAIASELALRGLHLILVGRRRDALSQVADALTRSHAITCVVLSIDLGDVQGVAALMAQLGDRDVGLLVAAAGFGTSGAFLGTGLSDELAMVDVNCRAVVELCHRLAPRLVARRRGGIILMSSLVGFQGVARAAHYAATKAYVQTLAEGLHLELKRYGVDVLASAPGPVRSGFAARANMHMAQAATPQTVAVGTLARLGNAMTTRPGLLAKALELSLTLLPRWMRARIMSLVMLTMTRHQNDVATHRKARSA